MVLRFSLFVCALCFSLTACGGAQKDASNKDVSPSSLVIHTTIDPDPPVVGTCTLLLELVDKDGTGVEGATVTVDPQMPMHGHGSTDTPVVEEIGGGSYAVSDVTFTMPGMWEVTVTAELAERELFGEQVFPYDVK